MPKAQLNFTIDEYNGRLAKTRAAMASAGIDVLIVTDPSNMNWLTGYDGWSFYVHQAVILPLDGDPIWFGRGIDQHGARRTTFLEDANIIAYRDHLVQSEHGHPMDDLAQQLVERNLATGTIGVEMDNYYYSAKAHMALTTGLPNAKFVDATGLVNWQRAVKSPAELGHMRQAAKLTEKIHARILEHARPGIRKCDLVAEIYDAGLRFDEAIGVGGDYPAIVPLLPSGSDAAAAHLTWDDTPMRANEGTFFEVSGVVHRYHAPQSRTVFFGKPPQHFLDAEKAIIEGLDAGMAKAVAGNQARDVAIAFFDVLERYGIKKDSRTGYPVGLSYPPDWGEHTFSLRRDDETVLQENMTFHFMTGLWMDDWGFELSETVLVGARTAERLVKTPQELFVIG